MTPKQYANRGFLIHALGAVAYVVGLAAMLPLACLMSDFPSIVHFDRTQPSQTVVVIYNTFVLANREFGIYFCVVPFLLLFAAIGINRMEKGWKMMEMGEKANEKMRRSYYE